MSYIVKHEDGSFTESAPQEEQLVNPESVCGQLAQPNPAPVAEEAEPTQEG